MICPKCNNKTFEDFEVKGAQFKICVKCGQAIQIQESEEYNKYCIEQQKIREQVNSKPSAPIVTCPYCQSTSVSKITVTKRAVKVGLFGIFGAMDDAGKTYKCNGCGCKF